MKIAFPIIIFSCFSVLSFAQKIPCEELMQMPLGNYIFSQDEDSMRLVVENLEFCDFDDFERERVLLSTFINSMLQKKGKYATVQDLYDVVLEFRQLDDYEATKALSKKQLLFKQKYFQEEVTNENWKKGKFLINELFGFDEVDLDEVINPLFEEKGNQLDITYGYLLNDIKIYIKNKYHLSKIAKRDSSDFDFGDEFYLFPSMNYDVRIQNIDKTKPTLVYFYGYGAVNCNKLNDNTFHNFHLLIVCA